MSLARAIAIGDLAELPSRRDEDWRWTDLRGLIRQLPPASAALDAPQSRGPFDGLARETVCIPNGELAARILAMADDQVMALRVIGEGDGAHTAAPKFKVGEGRLVLLESYEGAGGYLSEIDLTFEIGPGGEVERIVLADESEAAVSVSRADVTLAPGAKFAQTVIAAGARRQRIETRVAHAGGGATVRLDGVYLLAHQRHADITTVVTHDGRDGTTDQLTKGVVRDQARGVFQGRIVVAEGADKTDAKMGHHALILSERAEVDAKPELEIFADDVACAHGNTVGALDDDALFYAEQRGIPEAEARAMLTEAFVGEVVDRIEHEGAREVVRAWVAERLRGPRHAV
ncbi:MAG TPA: Fe-S cluster assembly protein SufD [Caulobacteraceae bacterium]|nr:Fe-S cluster assembly protein SufD [Caulobacteraceae bacterium]